MIKRIPLDKGVEGGETDSPSSITKLSPAVKKDCKFFYWCLQPSDKIFKIILKKYIDFADHRPKGTFPY